MADYEINWLPVETAPRNGAHIVIVYSGNGRAGPVFGVASWCTEDCVWMVDGYEYGESKGNWGWSPLPPYPPTEGTRAGEEWSTQVSARWNDGHAAAKAVVEKDEVESEEIMKAIGFEKENKAMSGPLTLPEIVAKLREYASDPSGYLDGKELYQAGKELYQAAVAIENLLSENARLRAAFEDLLDDTWIQDFGEWFEDRLKQARAALEWKP